MQAVLEATEIARTSRPIVRGPSMWTYNGQTAPYCRLVRPENWTVTLGFRFGVLITHKGVFPLRLPMR
jgi:hypothetical protein